MNEIRDPETGYLAYRYQYGASFLARTGYFNPQKRFWTREEFPEADTIRQRIVKFIREHIDSGGAGGTYYRHALELLGEKISPVI